MLKDYLSLCKFKIVALIVLVGGVTATIAGDSAPPWDRLAFLLVTGTLSSAGASTLNHYADHHLDAAMIRTRRRPLPAGRISPRSALLFGLALLVSSLPFSLQLNLQVALYSLSGAFAYVVIYTLWLKPRSTLSTVIGGVAGSCAVLASWSAINPLLTPVPIMLAFLVFLWTPCHFWSFAIVHQTDYREAGIPTLAAVAGEKRTAACVLLYSALLLPVSLLLYPVTPFGSVYLIGAILLGAIYLVSSVQLWKGPGQKKAWGNYKLSGMYLLGMFLIMFLDTLLKSI
ncbi:MAG: protoheme IX farnesyltransferase [Chloroflexi bacterium]|nr:protoheme IX farnesyltransferase [Chloroflexota bacterium]